MASESRQPLTHFRVLSFEGYLRGGYYQIHVVPSAKSQSDQSFFLPHDITGSVSANVDYVLPTGTLIQIGLAHGNEETQIPLRVRNSSEFLSMPVMLRAEFNKIRHRVEFEDQDGLQVVVTMEWKDINKGEYFITEGCMSWVDGKPRVKYERLTAG